MLDKITESIKTKVGTDCGLNASVKFVLDGEKCIHIDATQVPNIVSNDDKPADCTIKISTETIDKIISGDLNAMTAFMMGKIKVEGNMGIAMNLNKVL